MLVRLLPSVLRMLGPEFTVACCPALELMDCRSCTQVRSAGLDGNSGLVHCNYLMTGWEDPQDNTQDTQKVAADAVATAERQRVTAAEDARETAEQHTRVPPNCELQFDLTMVDASSACSCGCEKQQARSSQAEVVADLLACGHVGYSQAMLESQCDRRYREAAES